MKNSKLILIINSFLIFGCIDGVGETDTTTPICGNGIIEEEEECDEPFQCTNCIYDRRIFINGFDIIGYELEDIENFISYRCDEIAEFNGHKRPGIYWKAWIFANNQTPEERIIFHSPEKYISLDGIIIANNFDELSKGILQNSITMNQYFENEENLNVWTGSKENNCNNWASDQGFGTFGNNSFTNIQWNNYGSDRCSLSMRIYCIEDNNFNFTIYGD